MKTKIKLLVCDIDGTLTDGQIHQLEDGQEMKSFSCKDGAGFHILKHDFKDIKIVWITSEKQGVNLKRFEKLNRLGVVDYFIDNVHRKEKVKAILELIENKFTSYVSFIAVIGGAEIFLNKYVAFIGDDTNDLELLKEVKYKACPNDANKKVKKIKGIKVMKNKGGNGAVREFIDYLIKKDLF
jgi:N-acylneuraminate cytidylyltransferase